MEEYATFFRILPSNVSDLESDPPEIRNKSNRLVFSLNITNDTVYLSILTDLSIML